MLQVPDLLMIHSPIQAHLVIQYTHLTHQHLLRLEPNIILVVLWLVCADLWPSDHCMRLSLQVCNYISPAERGWRDYPTLSEIPYSQSPYTPRWDPGTVLLCVLERESIRESSCSKQLQWGISVCAGYQFSGSFFSCNASDSQPSPFTLDTSMRSAEALALSGTDIIINTQRLWQA